MVLKTTLQKESPKQSLPKVTSKAAVRRYCSLRPATLFKRDFDTSVFQRILRNFYEKLFYRTTPVAFIDLLFLIKKIVRWFLLRLVDLVIIRYLHLISRNHSNTLLFINLQKTKTCPK